MKISFISFFISLSFIGFGQQIDTAKVRMEVDSLLKIERDYYYDGKFKEGIQVSETAAEICLTAFDKKSPLYADIIVSTGYSYAGLGEFSKAETLYLEAKNIQEETIGKKHPDYAWTLNSLASLYNDMEQSGKAEKMFLEAISILKASGEKSRRYEKTLINLSNAYFLLNDFEKAEKILSEVQEVQANTIGENHFSYGGTLNNLGNIYWMDGRFEKAELMYLEALKIKENALGPNHHDVALSLINLGGLYNDMEQLPEAETAILRAMEIQEKTFDRTHYSFGPLLSRLATLYARKGNYEQAELVFLEVKAIWEKTGGKEHRGYTTCLYNLANLYNKVENYQQAIEMFSAAKEIFAQTLGEDHYFYADCLNGLAINYVELERFEEAEQMHVEAKEIRENILGKEHPDYAASLSNLGFYYYNMGELDKAESIYLEALEVYEKAFGKNHSEYSVVLAYLAKLYESKGDLKKAESLHLETKDSREKAVGKTHPLYVSSLGDLIHFYQKIDAFEKAGTFVPEYVEAEKLQLTKAARYLSESELLAYSNHFLNSQAQLNSFAQIQPKFSTLAYNNSLFYKSFLLNKTKDVKKIAQTNEESTDMYYNLLGLYRQLGAEYSNTSSDYQEVKVLEDKINTLEKKLARTVAGYASTITEVTWQDVQKQLPKGTAAIEFVHYQYHNPSPTDSSIYAAIVLRPDSKEPKIVLLFEEKQLDKSLTKQDQLSEFINHIYDNKNNSMPLSQLIYEPLKKELKDIQTIYYAPAGQLHRLNLAAIQVDKNTTLGDHFQLIQLGSTRQLITQNTTATKKNKQAILYGGIEYDAIENYKEAELTTTTALNRSLSSMLQFNIIDSTLQNNDWNYLKWTAVEIEAIELVLEDAGLTISTKKGQDASEEAFKKIGVHEPSPQILHLATHGFFFADPETKTISSLGFGSNEDPVFKVSDHPMIRSGLVLAGGNHAWKTGKPVTAGKEDGILTAYEISQMNLSNTELVVLSACETGLGDIEGNEGVYGLQRAFKLAGAKYLIMSLWQVPDFQTQELMTAFYYHWLEGGKSIPLAFKEAQSEIQKKYPNPFYWAGFVLVE